ncbi:MAG TPA: hypothetical protein VMH77_08615 [Steroidobacteraceae bacterium]|nr:hypothetical protein [Steroidobacteraceae bacterium]
MQRTTWLLASDPLLRRALWLSPAQGLRDALRTCLRELLVRAQEAGTLRVDLDPDYLAGTLLGLMLFPFLDGNPPALASGAAQLMLQHIALLRDGIVRADSPGRRRR